MSTRTLLVLSLLVLVSVPALAGPVPSRTAPNQSLEARDTNLVTIRSVAANDQVSAVLRAHGFTPEEVEGRLARMSPQDLDQLACNLEQVQAAGLTRQEWIWITVGALAALVLIAVLA